MNLNPLLVLSYLIAIAIDILFPLLLVLWVRRKYGVRGQPARVSSGEGG